MQRHTCRKNLPSEKNPWGTAGSVSAKTERELGSSHCPSRIFSGGRHILRASISERLQKSITLRYAREYLFDNCIVSLREPYFRILISYGAARNSSHCVFIGTVEGGILRVVSLLGRNPGGI